MIVPSIDIQEGRAVQLRGGAFPTLDLGDPLELAARLSRVGEIAVVDLDAARGRGENRALVERMARTWPSRVGGGIRTKEAALRYLDAGARALMIGTRADADFLEGLPKDRIIAALDVRDGEIMVEGWSKGTGQRIEERLGALAPFVSGFLVTFIEREGRLQGLDLARARAVVEAVSKAAPGCRVTFAGGATQATEIAELEAIGADVQAGTAIAMGQLDLAAAFAAPLRSDRADGLWPTVVCDEGGRALGLAWSDLESLKAAVDSGRGFYKSRRRGLWEKGSESGNTQELIVIETDCDHDSLRFTVRQKGPFCHKGSRSCFGPATGFPKLEATLAARRIDAPKGSYTRKLFEDPELLAAKLPEEAAELAAAASREDAVSEAADLVYFALAKLALKGAGMADVEAELDRRSLKLTRRGGAAKPEWTRDEWGATWNGLH